jgi:hypothetical protein
MIARWGRLVSFGKKKEQLVRELHELPFIAPKVSRLDFNHDFLDFFLPQRTPYSNLLSHTSHLLMVMGLTLRGRINCG